MPAFALPGRRALGIGVEQLTPDDVWMLHFVSASPDFSYVIFAIFASCVVCGILFLPTLLKFSFEFDGRLLKQMLVKKYGRIINMASLSGLKGLPGQCNYSAAKGGLIAATKALAQEVGRKGVTVNAVAPGIRKD